MAAKPTKVTTRTGLTGAITRHPAVGIVGGLLGLAAAGTAAGVAASRIAARRGGAAALTDEVTTPAEPTAAALRRDDPLGAASRAADRTAVVLTDDGVPLAVEEIGPADAPLTVVFVHGYTLSMASWTFQRRTLAAGLATANGHRPDARLVFYDQRGHGSSGRGHSENSTIDQLARDLDAVIEARAPHGPVVLAGHSMGGMTIMAWAADHAPELTARVRGVVLVATSAKVGDDRIRLPLEGPLMRASARAPRIAPGRLLSTRSQARLLYGRETARATVVPGVTLIRRTSLPTMGRWFLALQSHDEREALAHLGSVPTRVLVGTADRLTPVSDAWALTNGIRGARLSVLPGLGHMLTYEAPDTVADAVGELISAA
jgi:pimeloyl-ACP methyl ester carboxylesterase